MAAITSRCATPGPAAAMAESSMESVSAAACRVYASSRSDCTRRHSPTSSEASSNPAAGRPSMIRWAMPNGKNELLASKPSRADRETAGLDGLDGGASRRLIMDGRRTTASGRDAEAGRPGPEPATFTAPGVCRKYQIGLFVGRGRRWLDAIRVFEVLNTGHAVTDDGVLPWLG